MGKHIQNSKIVTKILYSKSSSDFTIFHYRQISLPIFLKTTSHIKIFSQLINFKDKARIKSIVLI